MIRRFTCTAIFTVFGCALAPLGARAAVPLTKAVRAELRSSAIPVLLPTRLPGAVGPIESMAVISAGRDGYYVGFSALRRCNGALSCAALHVAGYPFSSPAGRAYGSDRPIRLPDGSHGFYAARDCSGASCTEGSLTFKRGHAIYEIDANVARESLPALLEVYRQLQPIAPDAHHGR